MVREPQLRDAAELLRKELAVLNFNLPANKALDIVVKLKGYGGYQAYVAKHGSPPKRGEKSTTRAFSLKAASFEQTVARLRETFNNEEWPFFPRSDWELDAINRDTKLDYWTWCLHQAEACDDIRFYLDEAYVMKISNVEGHRDGWWWFSDRDWRFLRDGAAAPAGVLYNGPFTTEKLAQSDLARGHPLTVAVHYGEASGSATRGNYDKGL